MTKITSVELATALSGLEPYSNNNINSTYIGPVRLSNGSNVQALIKDVGPKEIANEVFCATLGRALSVPIPRPLLVLVREDTKPLQKAPTLNDTNDRIAFGSELVTSPSLGQRCNQELNVKVISAFLERWQEAGIGYSFDTWVANIDRNLNNLLFDGKDEVWLIDHGKAFTNDRWELSDLVASSVYMNKMDYWLIPHLTNKQKVAFGKSITKLAENAAKLVLSAAAEASRLESLLTPEDRDCVLDFLAERVKHVARLATTGAGLPAVLI